MNQALQNLVNKIHESDTKAYVVCSGGGSEVFPLLLSGGGGSKTLLAGHIPYSFENLREFVGYVDKAVSEETAWAMATRAYEKALDINKDSLAVGIGLTASLRRVPEEREGRVHEVYAVLESAFKTIKVHFVFDTKKLYLLCDDAEEVRRTEETGCAVIILRMLADYSGIAFKDNDSNVGKLEKYETTDFPVNIAVLNETFIKTPGLGTCRLLFPGSFNPPHEGHLEMAEMASELIHWPCSLEISVQNVDKGELSHKQIADRLITIRKTGLFTDYGISPNRTNILLTKAPTFVEKAKLFPESTFIIGFDTATRIVDPKYGIPIDEALQCFEDYKIKFLLFPRIIDGTLKDDLSVLPKRFRDLCTFVKKPRKYAHLSSREIRNGTN